MLNAEVEKLLLKRRLVGTLALQASRLRAFA